MIEQWIVPAWPVPERIGALSTTRPGGVSRPPWAGLNLGAHVGDDSNAVATNRALVQAMLPGEPVWLDQVHGIRVLDADRETGGQADAAISRQPGRVLAIMTADCLPVLFCDVQGTVVAAAHAGWKGLLAGVLEAAVEAMQTPAERIRAWCGPAIGPAAFEVGNEVRESFVNHSPEDAAAFTPGRPGKWQADLCTLARARLNRAGVTDVFASGLCTYADAERFYSYRRDGQTGRMASFIWIRPD